ncbi:hypothetical protein JL722_7061 [Aureococcus anophagefferens]|nr:hypothetical protein JL722_7061 [Aureococcus anophagefferens]
MNAAVEAARAARRPLKRINEKREANADDNVYYSPIKDLHAFQGSREEAGLAAAARDVLLGDEVATLLEKITGHASQLLYRSAYFEYSRTTAHQDYYYFDSLNAVNAYLDAKVAGPWAGAVFAPDLKAGDALVWNSWLVHGSLAGDVRTTRKSLIGHFTPAHLDIRSFVDPAMTMASLPKGDDRGRAYYDTEAAGRGPHFDQPVVHTRHHRGAAGGGRPEAAVR